MTVWNPGQVSAQNVNRERRTHKKRAHPETPVAVHSSPIRTGIGFASIATISFGVMFIAGQSVDSFARHKRSTVADATS